MSLNETGFGVEIVEREAIKILYEELNDELIAVQDEWEDRDIEINQLTGEDPITVELELIEENNFYYGHRPSLLEAPITSYPNVCAIADTADPSESEMDQFNNYEVSLAIEIMCKSLYNESEVNRRTARTAEAVNRVLMRNDTLNGECEGFDSDPSLVLTNVFTRSDNPQGSDQWYWRAARIDYFITRNAKLPEGY
jgi:hypothetical protein